MSKDVYRKLIDERAPAPDYEALQRRLAPRPTRWLVPALALAAAVALAVVFLRPDDAPSDMTIYVGLSDRPASEALEIHLRDWRNTDAQALFGSHGGRTRLARGGAGHLAR